MEAQCQKSRGGVQEDVIAVVEPRGLSGQGVRINTVGARRRLRLDQTRKQERVNVERCRGPQKILRSLAVLGRGGGGLARAVL